MAATITSTPIAGECDSRFERVKSAFADNFATRGDIGASVCVFLEGRKVVDLWGGYADADRTRQWQPDTLVNVWSLGKAMTALSLLKVMEITGLTPDTALASVWPGFAAGGKTDITFDMAMSHRAGLCAIEAPLPDDAFFHWDLMCEAIAAQRPWWEPGSAHGYHTNTYGFLLGEPLRRITGHRLRDWFRTHVGTRLDVDFHFGVDPRDLHRCADVIHGPRPAAARNPAATPDDPAMATMRERIYNNPSLSKYDYNASAWRQAEFPSTNPQSNARSVATVFAELGEIAGGRRQGIISRELLQQALEIRADGEDLNVGRPTRFGLGFQLTQPVRPFGPNEGAFGHYGNGGHIGFADPKARIAFAWHMNYHGYAWRDPRNIALVDAVYDSL